MLDCLPLSPFFNRENCFIMKRESGLHNWSHGSSLGFRYCFHICYLFYLFVSWHSLSFFFIFCSSLCQTDFDEQRRYRSFLTTVRPKMVHTSPSLQAIVSFSITPNKSLGKQYEIDDFRQKSTSSRWKTWRFNLLLAEREMAGDYDHFAVEKSAKEPRPGGGCLAWCGLQSLKFYAGKIGTLQYSTLRSFWACLLHVTWQTQVIHYYGIRTLLLCNVKRYV